MDTNTKGVMAADRGGRQDAPCHPDPAGGPTITTTGDRHTTAILDVTIKGIDNGRL
jgi:cation transporter-like permease